MNYMILPNLIALAILVGVFWAISRKASNDRLDLWLAGWFLVLLHFFAQFLTPVGQASNRVLTTISLDALILAGTAFLISVSVVGSITTRRFQLLLAIGLPCVVYADACIWNISSRTFYYAVIAAGVVAPVVLVWRFNQKSALFASVMTAGTALAGLLMARAVYLGASDAGIIVLLAALYFVTAALYWRHHQRASAGVLTAIIGFVLWGAVFPLGALLSVYAPNLKIESEVWNIPKYLVAVGMILTLLESQIQRSTYLAYHDELTGLPNRRLLDDRLERALAFANRAGQKVAVLQLDLDRFKEVNDTFGHRVGDLALQGVVARLAARIRNADTLARSGGDEFTVVSVVHDRASASVLVSHLEDALSAPMNIEGVPVQTGLSIGVALYPEDGSNADELHAAADKAMYIAKRAARCLVSSDVAQLN